MNTYQTLSWHTFCCNKKYRRYEQKRAVINGFVPKMLKYKTIPQAVGP